MKTLKALILVGLVSSTLFAAPSWYINRDYKLPSANETLGYGEGEELQSAITVARADLTHQLSTQVYSKYTIEKNRVESELTSQSHLYQSSESDMILEDSNIIKQQLDDGKWYVVVSFENIPYTSKFVKKIKANNPDVVQTGSKSYFSKTELGQEIKALLDIDCQLIYQDGWKLKYQNIYQNLGAFNIPDLFINYEPQLVPLVKRIPSKNSPSILINLEKTKFVFNSTSKYVSVFAVSPDGNVLCIEDNVPGKYTTKEYSFAQKVQGEERNIMFVVTYNEEYQDNSAYRIMNAKESLESYKNDKMKIDKFMQFLNGKKYGARKMVIKSEY